MPRLDSPWDLAFAVSVVAFVAALGFAVVPPPARIDPSVGLRKSLGDNQAVATKAGALARTGHARLLARTWALEPEALGVEVLGIVNRTAERRRLEVSNFNAGRPLRSAGLRQVPFMVTLTGPFPDVMATMAELERPVSRLVIGGVKLAPNTAVAKDAEGISEPGRVTATLSITAFLRGEGA